MPGPPIARVQAYVDSIPDGLDSYSDAKVKYSVVDTWIEGHDRAAIQARVPDPILPLLEDGFPVSRWVPEVHATVVYLTLRELFFANDDAFVADALERNTALLRRPIYRVLMRLLSVTRAAQGPSIAYSQMHRGTDLIVKAEPHAWLVTLKHPPYLIPEVMARCYGTALRAAIQEKGGTDVRVQPESSSPEEKVYSLTFS